MPEKKYELEHPKSMKVTIRQWLEETYKKIGEIEITSSTVYWKSGEKGTQKKHHVSMDDFIKWMNTKPTRY